MKRNGKTVWPRRVALGLVGLAGVGALSGWLYLRASMAQLDGSVRGDGLTATVTVARDAHGIPLISGAGRADVAYATGYVHAQDRYFQMDLLRRVAAGELAELFGARALEVDQAHRLHRFRARAERALQAMRPAERALLDRYVDGVNAGLQALGARPFEYALAGGAPRPWSAADTLLITWAMYFDLQGDLLGRELARGWFREHSTPEQRAFLAPELTSWDVPLDAARLALTDAPIPATAPDWWGQERAPDAPRIASIEFQHAIGSNNWAVAGGRAPDGAAIVANDMHLGIQLPAIWYRAALQFPDARGGKRRVVGATLPGTPLVVVGSNGHVAWGFTNSYGDYLDLIALGTDPARPGQVRAQGGWETPVTHGEAIRVKGEPDYLLQVRDSSLGPIREVRGRSYAIHWTAHAAGASNLNLGLLETADTLDDAMAVVPTMGIPELNFVGGDDHGNIGWTIAGLVPRRAVGGGAASYPMTADDPAGVWQGWLAPADYPRVRNPADGQISTANNRPLLGEGASLLGDGGFMFGARAHQVRDDLSALGARTSVKQVYEIGLDDRALYLTGWRERALRALDAQALAGHPARAEARRLLQESWSGHASVDSVGYRITRAYMYALYDLVYQRANGELSRLDAKASMVAVSSAWPAVMARLVDERPAGWLPAVYANWQALQLAALDRVIADLSKDGKVLSSATWGERNTAQSAHPFSSAVPLLGRWLKVPADMLPGDIHMPRVAGPTFGQSERLTVAPGREEQGIFNMPGGQSGHPLSPYFLDGRAEWLAGKATPLLPGPPAHTLTFTK